jgi:hypothetical protein
MLTGKGGEMVLAHHRRQSFRYEQEVALHHPHENSRSDSGKRPDADCVADGLLAPLFLLLGFERRIDVRLLFLRVMDGTSEIRAYLLDFALADPIGDDGLGGELTRLVLGSPCLFLVLRFLRQDGNVLATRHDGTSLLRLRKTRADLHELGLGGDGIGYVRVQLRLITAWVGALCGIWANCKSFLLALRRRTDRVSPFEGDCE